MGRTSPVHSGYTIKNGTTTGKSYEKADTWVEYTIVSQSVATNQTRIKAYFYTALASGETSATYDNQNGGVCTSWTINGVNGTKVWINNPYNYKISTPMLVASYDGSITHNADGTKTITIAGAYTVTSSYISGGNISFNITLPAIDRGLARVKDGTTWRQGIVYVKDGTTWRQGILYVKDGTTWRMGG